MTDQDFVAAMRIGLPRIAAPATNRCECDPASNYTCDDCEAVEAALRQHGNREHDHV